MDGFGGWLQKLMCELNNPKMEPHILVVVLRGGDRMCVLCVRACVRALALTLFAWRNTQYRHTHPSVPTRSYTHTCMHSRTYIGAPLLLDMLVASVVRTHSTNSKLQLVWLLPQRRRLGLPLAHRLTARLPARLPAYLPACLPAGLTDFRCCGDRQVDGLQEQDSLCVGNTNHAGPDSPHRQRIQHNRITGRYVRTYVLRQRRPSAVWCVR